MRLRAIPLDQILPNPEQPRRTFDEATLAELAQSLRAEGLIQPVAVEATATGSYILTDGARRVRAARLAGLTEIPAIVHAPASGENQRLHRLIRALVANVQREDLGPLDLARALQRLHDLGMTDEQISAAVGKSRPVVCNKRRLLKLPEEALARLASGEISERQALALLSALGATPEGEQPEQIERATTMTSEEIRRETRSRQPATRGRARRTGSAVALREWAREARLLLLDAAKAAGSDGKARAYRRHARALDEVLGAKEERL